MRPGPVDIHAWLNDPVQRPLVLELLREATGARLDVTRLDQREVAALLERAFARGELRARRLRLPAPHIARTEEKQAPLEKPSDIKKKTWIAIEVVDDRKPPRPVAGLRWRITLPDGEVREGRTDEKGKARIDGIEEGVGDVTFPDVDGSEWRQL